MASRRSEGEQGRWFQTNLQVCVLLLPWNRSNSNNSFSVCVCCGYLSLPGLLRQELWPAVKILPYLLPTLKLKYFLLSLSPSPTKLSPLFPRHHPLCCCSSLPWQPASSALKPGTWSECLLPGKETICSLISHTTSMGCAHHDARGKSGYLGSFLPQLTHSHVMGTARHFWSLLSSLGGLVSIPEAPSVLT